MKITITCYGTTETYTSRAAALKRFKTCERNSEGSERERYTAIIWQLEDGLTDISDMNPDYNF